MTHVHELSAIAEMSRAISSTVERHAPTLRELDDDVLRGFSDIVNAFGHDLHAELVRRNIDLAERRRKEGNDGATDD